MNTNTTRSLQNAVVALVITGILLLALGGYLAPLSRLAFQPLVAVQAWIAERYQAVELFINAPRDTAELRQRNAELEAQVGSLQTQLIELERQIAEVQVLSALLDFQRANPQNEYITASVIGRDTNPFLKYVIINRGSDDGLRRGMPVVTQQGLVGRIAAVTANAARVQLITDPDIRINVRIDPSDAEAVLLGSITSDISLDMIPLDASVQAGDLVLTSGLGGNYPDSLLIGQISGVRSRDYDLFQSASIQPVVDFNRLDIVLVITNFQPVDITPLLPASDAGSP